MPVKIIATDILTNISWYYPSITDAIRKNDLVKWRLYQALRTGTVYEGKIWKIMEGYL